MKLTRRAAAVLLAVILAWSAAFSVSAAPYPIRFETELDDDYSGKTVILHTNDVHGEIQGYAVMAALRTAFQRRGAEVLLLDVGDFSVGTSYVNYSKGRDAVTMMNAAGYNAVSPGNHEFDFGPRQLAANLSQANFPIVCANVYWDGERMFQPNWTYTTKSGMKLGFFGLDTPETLLETNPDRVQGVTFLTGQPLLNCAQEQVNTLKSQGCDLIIAMCHLGVNAVSSPTDRSLDVYRNTTGIDFVLDGHSHVRMTEGDRGDPVQSTGAKSINAGVVILDDRSESVQENFLIPMDGLDSDDGVQAAAQAVMDRVTAAYRAAKATNQVTLSSAGATAGEIPLGDLVTDGMRASVLRDYSITQVGNDHVVCLLPGEYLKKTLPAGTITRLDIQNVLPTDATVCLVTVTGAQLLEALEAGTYYAPAAFDGFPQTSGITYSVKPGVPYDAGTAYEGSNFRRPASIKRVEISSINGKAFSPTDTYIVVTDHESASGNGAYGVFAGAPRRDTGLLLEEAVSAYIQEDLKTVISSARYGKSRGDQTWAGGGFRDVLPGTYYYDAVFWAVEEGIAYGTSSTAFSPNKVCTRGQMAAFLWRMAGSPKPKTTVQFTDVKETDYYYEAVSWAAQQGITAGTGNNRFSPNAYCTRAQMVTFLYKAAGSPRVRDRVTFKDVKESDYFYDAVSWAAEAGVTAGTGSGRFSPNSHCTRGQIMTFLYRYDHGTVIDV